MAFKTIGLLRFLLLAALIPRLFGSTTSILTWQCAKSEECAATCGAQCMEECVVEQGSAAATAIVEAQHCLRKAFVRGAPLKQSGDSSGDVGSSQEEQGDVDEDEDDTWTLAEADASCKDLVTADVSCFLSCEGRCSEYFADQFRVEDEDSAACVGMCESECSKLKEELSKEEEEEEEDAGEEAARSSAMTDEDVAKCLKFCAVSSCPAVDTFYVMNPFSGEVETLAADPEDLEVRAKAEGKLIAALQASEDEAADAAESDYTRQASPERQRITVALADEKSPESIDYQRYIQHMQAVSGASMGGFGLEEIFGGGMGGGMDLMQMLQAMGVDTDNMGGDEMAALIEQMTAGMMGEMMGGMMMGEDEYFGREAMYGDYSDHYAEDNEAFGEYEDDFSM